MYLSFSFSSPVNQPYKGGKKTVVFKFTNAAPSIKTRSSQIAHHLQTSSKGAFVNILLRRDSKQQVRPFGVKKENNNTAIVEREVGGERR